MLAGLGVELRDAGGQVVDVLVRNPEQPPSAMVADWHARFVEVLGGDGATWHLEIGTAEVPWSLGMVSRLDFAFPSGRRWILDGVPIRFWDKGNHVPAPGDRLVEVGRDDHGRAFVLCLDLDAESADGPGGVLARRGIRTTDVLGLRFGGELPDAARSADRILVSPEAPTAVLRDLLQANRVAEATASAGPGSGILLTVDNPWSGSRQFALLGPLSVRAARRSGLSAEATTCSLMLPILTRPWVCSTEAAVLLEHAMESLEQGALVPSRLDVATILTVMAAARVITARDDALDAARECAIDAAIRDLSAQLLRSVHIHPQPADPAWRERAAWAVAFSSEVRWLALGDEVPPDETRMLEELLALLPSDPATFGADGRIDRAEAALIFRWGRGYEIADHDARATRILEVLVPLARETGDLAAVERILEEGVSPSDGDAALAAWTLAVHLAPLLADRGTAPDSR